MRIERRQQFLVVSTLLNLHTTQKPVMRIRILDPAFQVNPDP